MRLSPTPKPTPPLHEVLIVAFAYGVALWLIVATLILLGHFLGFSHFNTITVVLK